MREYTIVHLAHAIQLPGCEPSVRLFCRRCYRVEHGLILTVAEALPTSMYPTDGPVDPTMSEDCFIPYHNVLFTC